MLYGTSGKNASKGSVCGGMQYIIDHAAVVLPVLILTLTYVLKSCVAQQLSVVGFTRNVFDIPADISILSLTFICGMIISDPSKNNYILFAVLDVVVVIICFSYMTFSKFRFDEKGGMDAAIIIFGLPVLSISVISIVLSLYILAPVAVP